MMKKRLCAFLLGAFLMFGMLMQFPVTARAAGSFGTWGGIDWTLSEDGTLTIAPTKGTPVPDPNCGKAFAVGAWREAVVYNSSGAAASIGGAPYDMNAVKSLIIKEGVISIGSFAAKFPNLTGEVVIPSTVTYIGQEAFQNCPITTLIFAPGGTKDLCIAPGAFKTLEITELVLPADRPEIHLHCWAFLGSSKLENISIPDNVTFLPQTHLEYCGMDNSYTNDSQVLKGCPIEGIAFGSDAVRDRFENAPYNKSNMNAWPNLKTPIHTCQQSSWIREENSHYKKQCLYNNCPIGLNNKVFAKGAHTFGADNACTTCGYLRDTEKTAAPQTGDTTHTLLWAALFFGGVAMMWMQLNARKRETF